MKKAKAGLLILGMAVLIGGGSVTAQASPLHDFPDQSPGMHSRHHDVYRIDFRQTPQERKKMLELLHIDEKNFEREIRRGKSIAEIAADRDVPVKAVVKLIEHQIKDHINLDKHEHRISPQQAADMKEHAREQAKEIVNRSHR